MTSKVDMAWQEAKDQARNAMIERAKSKTLPMSYSDLVGKITAMTLEPYDQRLFKMLGEISTEEDRAGRGMLTALVVHKHDSTPGQGFYDLAKSLGRDVSDKDRCWLDELNRVYGDWDEKRACPPHASSSASQ